MGVDYSNSIGYGYVIPDEAFHKDYDPESEVSDLLKQNSLDLIGVDTCGNMMTGDNCYVFVYIKSTFRRTDVYDAEYLVEMDHRSLSIENLDQLFRSVDLLNTSEFVDVVGSTQTIGWKALFNVS